MKVSLRQLALAMAGAGMLTIHGCGGGSGDTAPPPTSEVASLPAYLLTQPASSNCAALRSGTYNQILLVPDGPGFPDKISKFVIDAAAGTWNVGASSTALIASGESCHYTMTGGTEFVVSPAGVMVSASAGALQNILESPCRSRPLSWRIWPAPGTRLEWIAKIPLSMKASLRP